MYYRDLLAPPLEIDLEDEARPRPAAEAAHPRAPESERTKSMDDLMVRVRTRDPIGDASSGEPMTCYSWDDTSETVMKFDGTRWTVTQKDIASGRIERFTQSSGSGDHGRLEMMQGAPVHRPAGALERQSFAWHGVEDRGLVLSTTANVQLPRSMRNDVAGAILSAPGLVGPAMNILLPDPVRLERSMKNAARSPTSITRRHRGPFLTRPVPRRSRSPCPTAPPPQARPRAR